MAITTPNFVWTVGSGNTWGADNVGYLSDAVVHYRNAGTVPCSTSFPQDMTINEGTTRVVYITNQLRAGITLTSVWSERAGQYAERVWP